MLQKNYKAEYEATKGKNIAVKVTADMVISQMITPILSRKRYTDQARKTLGEYNLDASKLFEAC